MKVNYHTHTPRCQHALGTDEEYIQSAIQSKMDILGISDHGPFPDHDFGLRMKYEELDEYLNTMGEYASKYQSQLRILKGLEIEYLPEYNNYYEKLIADDRIDYLLLGEHFYHKKNGEMQNIYSAQSTDTYIEYAQAIVEGMKTGYFNMVVHPDLMFMGEYAWDDNCSRATDIIIDAAVKHDYILEYNANGLRREIKDYPDGQRHPYPHIRFWEQVANTNIRVIVGADAHQPYQVWDSAVLEAIETTKKLNLHVIHEIL
jgi:histidinol-phosphatase (PHP family)